MTYAEIFRDMMDDVGIPEEYWQAAAYMLNFIKHAAGDHVSLYGLLDVVEKRNHVFVLQTGTRNNEMIQFQEWLETELERYKRIVNRCRSINADWQPA